MELTMLGTGAALVTECYNACFMLTDDDGSHLLVDAGGGNGILRQMKRAGFAWSDVHDIFVTHKHLDHLLGAVWAVRMICQGLGENTYHGEARVYANNETICLLEGMVRSMVREQDTRFLGSHVHLIAVEDGEVHRVLNNRRIEFFDIGSPKATQFGFSLDLGQGRHLVCTGDEPCQPVSHPYVRNCDWLVHEAYCLESEAKRFHAYERFHSTVADTCKTAEKLQVQNLMLYHSMDNDLAERKTRYLEEGRRFFTGNLLVPDDLERIALV